MMSSLFVHIWALICCCCVTACALHTETCDIHAQKQAGSVSTFSVLWYLRSICNIINYSQPGRCASVSECARVSECTCQCVCVFGHEMFPSDLRGSSHGYRFFLSLPFFFVSWNKGSSLWMFTEERDDASFLDTLLQICIELLQV